MDLWLKCVFLSFLLLTIPAAKSAQVMQIKEGYLLRSQPNLISDSIYFARPGHLLLGILKQNNWVFLSDGLHTGWAPSKLLEVSTRNEVQALFSVSDLKNGKINYPHTNDGLGEKGTPLSRNEEDSLVEKAKELEKLLGNEPTKLYQPDRFKSKKP